jgi:CubicO group peptidase (beta-lactamase class C family)
VHGALAAQRLVGAVVLVYQHGQARRLAAGWADREAQLAMAQDAVFRWASASKPVVSAAVLRLVAQGRVRWTTPSRPGCRTFARACRMAAKRASRCASC